MLLNNDDPTVLIHDFQPTALELCLVTLGLTDSDLHTRFQQEVKLTHCLAIHTDSPALQCQLDLVTTLLDIF